MKFCGLITESTLHTGIDADMQSTDAVFCSVSSLGSLLDFLKSDTGCRLQLPKLIDFSAQVITPICFFVTSLLTCLTTVNPAYFHFQT